MTPLWIKISEPEPFVYNDRVFNIKTEEVGLVMSATKDMARVRYYWGGFLDNYDRETPASDLINDSSK